LDLIVQREKVACYMNRGLLMLSGAIVALGGRKRHDARGRVTRFSLFLLAAASAAANPNLQLMVGSQTIPAGATAQIKITLATPTPVASGKFYASLDPKVFSQIVSVGAYSSKGDVSASVDFSGLAIGVTFSSKTGDYTSGVDIPTDGMGRLPDLPAFTITVTTRPDAAPGTTAAVSLDVSPAPWQDAAGNTYSVSVTPGTITIGGALSIASVTPGGNLPAGTTVQVKGTGFDPKAVLSAAGLAISNPKFISDQEMDFTLTAAAEITGRRIAVTNPDGSQAEFFPILPGFLQNGQELIFPLRTAVYFGSGASGAYFQNPNTVVANVSVTDQLALGPAPPTPLAPGQVLSASPRPYVGSYITSSAPLRSMEAGFLSTFPISINLSTGGSTNFIASAGSTRTIQVSGNVTVASAEAHSTPQISVSTQSGGNWLSVSTAPAPNGLQLTIMLNPAGLAPGTYLGSIDATVTGLTSNTSASLPVRLDIVPAPIDVLLGYQIDVTAGNGINADPNVFPAGATATFSTDFGSWLSVSYDSSRALFNFTADPTGLGPGRYTGEVVLKGPGASETIPVVLRIDDPTVLKVRTNQVLATVFGASAPAISQSTVNVTSAVTGLKAAVATHSGGAWLHATLASSTSVLVTTDATGLADGNYTGVVSLTSDVPGITQVAVALEVARAHPPVISSNPLSFDISLNAGGKISSNLSLDAGLFGAINALTSPLSFQISTADGGNWLSVIAQDQASYIVQFDATSVAPGTYTGTIRAPAQNLTIPVTLRVTAPFPSSWPPFIATVVNAASAAVDSISPGELVTIYGLSLGSSTPSNLTWNASGNVSTTLGGTQVTFNGIPAPLTYVSHEQINAVVPFEVQGSSAVVQVQYAPGGTSNSVTLPVVPAVPGVFTLTGNGVGPGAILNEDGSVNTVDNRAARGSAIQIYATGNGLNSPANPTGSIPSSAANSVLPVRVAIGGVEAKVLYAGAAPDEVAGVLQINAVVPVDLQAGSAIPISVLVGGASSPLRATVAVQ
jgi:uncharacterized protein (TIGR03437 family)